MLFAWSPVPDSRREMFFFPVEISIFSFWYTHNKFQWFQKVKSKKEKIITNKQTKQNKTKRKGPLPPQPPVCLCHWEPFT